MLLDVLNQWQRYLNARAGSESALDAELAAMLMHNRVGNAQAQTRATACGLGSEKRVEDIFAHVFRHAAAVVFHNKVRLAVAGLTGKADFALVPDGANGLFGIKNKMEQHFEQLFAISIHPDRIHRAIVTDFDVVSRKLIRAQLEEVVGNGPQIDVTEVLRRASGEGAEIGDKMLEADRFRANGLKLAAQAGLQPGTTEDNFAETENRRKRIIDFVRHAGNQLAKRGELGRA